MENWLEKHTPWWGNWLGVVVGLSVTLFIMWKGGSDAMNFWLSVGTAITYGLVAGQLTAIVTIPFHKLWINWIAPLCRAIKANRDPEPETAPVD